MSINESPIARIELKNAGRRMFMGRLALSAAAIASLAMTTGCHVSTTNGVTTVTIEVSEIDSYATAALNIIKTILSFTSLPTAVTTAANLAISGIQSALTAWDKYSNGQASIVFDRTSVPTELQSVLKSVQDAGNTLASVAASEADVLGDKLTGRVQVISQDVSSLASIISSAIGTFTSTRLAGASLDTPRQQKTREVDMLLVKHGLKPIN